MTRDAPPDLDRAHMRELSGLIGADLTDEILAVFATDLAGRIAAARGRARRPGRADRRSVTRGAA